MDPVSLSQILVQTPMGPYEYCFLFSDTVRMTQAEKTRDVALLGQFESLRG